MRPLKSILALLVIALVMLPVQTQAKRRKKSTAPQALSSETRAEITAYLSRVMSREIRNCPVSIKSSLCSADQVTITMSDSFSYFPFRENSVKEIKDSVRLLLPEKLRNRHLRIITDSERIETLIPQCFRTSMQKPELERVPETPSKKKAGKKRCQTESVPAANPAPGHRIFTNNDHAERLVQPVVRNTTLENALDGKHIALWQSHGYYFRQNQNQWSWQRPTFWQTVEDMYTQSYILPFLVPMLENAGAIALLPRERSFCREELIADNDHGVDTQSTYSETGKWTSTAHGTGFAHRRQIYQGSENPFEEGTSRYCQTVSLSSGNESTAAWGVFIPRSGVYPLYVSYRTCDTSTDAAYYRVDASPKTQEIIVNQTMASGTWVYLGSFYFKQGMHENLVTLTNRSTSSGRTVSADAIRVGGGMGNIARTACDSVRQKITVPVDYTPQTSGKPRYVEGARYYLQWAGYDKDVYAPKHGHDDYKEDFMSRSRWVNAMMGGTKMMADEPGKRIPVDLALAFHTDAGVTSDSLTVGTLGIFYTKFKEKRFAAGVSRYVSRDLTDMVMTQICQDLRHTVNPEWSRRGMWNKSYYEARLGWAPTMLLELLSHQNQSDMRYGMDPKFRFIVSRAIYKGILRHLATQYSQSVVVQPLPVNSFSALLSQDGTRVELKWQPTPDPQEGSADAEEYIIYCSKDDDGFELKVKSRETWCTMELEPGHTYSFRVTASNRGGESFPSQTLSCTTKSNPTAKRIAIINGYDRISGPEWREDGFHNEFDSGAGYMQDVAFVGEQWVHDLSKRSEKTESEQLGFSCTDHEGEIIAANTLDFPKVYCRALSGSDFSISSLSRRAAEEHPELLNDFDAVILILGKQRCIKDGYYTEPQFSCFSEKMIEALKGYLSRGGRLLCSGSYMAWDSFCNPLSTDSQKEFCEQWLHFRYGGEITPRPGIRVFSQPGIRAQHISRMEAEVNTLYSQDLYRTDRTDILTAVGAQTIMQYSGSRRTAGVSYKGLYRSICYGFPLEGITSAQTRDSLIKESIELLFKQ